MTQMIKNLPAMWETWVWSLGWEDSLEKGMATHSSVLAWRIPWTEEPGGLQSMGLQRVRHYWVTNTLTTKIRKKTRVSTLTTTVQYSFESPSHSNQRRKRYKRNPDWRKRSKTLTVCRWHDLLHRKSWRYHQEIIRANQ